VLIRDWLVMLPIGLLPSEYEAPQQIRVNAVVLVHQLSNPVYPDSISSVFDYRCLLEVFTHPERLANQTLLLETLCDEAWRAVSSCPLVFGLTITLEKTALLEQAAGLGVQRTWLNTEALRQHLDSLP
jgi:dihydroneopterin aldolase